MPRCLLVAVWIMQMWCIHTIEFYSDIEKSERKKFLRIWINRERITLAMWPKLEK